MCKAIHPFSLISFLLALCVGVSSFLLLSQAEHRLELPEYPFVQREFSCLDSVPRIGKPSPSERFFTVDELKAKIGQEVRYAKPDFHKNTGRVISLGCVESGKVFAIVYWDAAEDGKPAFRTLSKTYYEKLVIEN
jgi:hypothetical protein